MRFNCVHVWSPVNPAPGSSTSSWNPQLESPLGLDRKTKSVLKIQIDGAARGNPGPAGIGAILADGTGRKRKELSVYLGETTNNVAETCALILALQQALQMGAKRVTVLSDSELLTRQVTGLYRVKNTELKWLHVLIRNLVGGFDDFKIQHVPRTENRQADRLANRAVTEALKKMPARQSRKRSASVPPRPDQPTFF